LYQFDAAVSRGFYIHGAFSKREEVSGFRVQGSGFRVQGSGFRVQGSGFRVAEAASLQYIWGDARR